MHKKIIFLILLLIILSGAIGSILYYKNYQKKEKFTVTWSIYAGWMPWSYAYDNGIIKKWADKYNIEIEFKQADYIPSIESYVSNSADGVVMTNIEAVNMVASAGIDSTAVVMGDYSNGNDAVLARDTNSLCDLEYEETYLVKYSVSHYLFSRGFENLCKKDVASTKLINANDSDLISIFLTNKEIKSVVTWNPLVLEIKSQEPTVKDLFNSSQIPYEILDILFLKTEVIKKHPELALALRGAWYETTDIMSQNNEQSKAVIHYMAQKAGTTDELFIKQLETTYLWSDKQTADEFVGSNKIKEAMNKVIEFSYRYELLGPNNQSNNYFGIQFPDGSTIGDKNNIKIRFANQF